MNLIVSSIGQGLLWALLGLGLYLTFRILDFCDMTVEGTFPLGAATAVTAIANGINPFLATLLAIGAGMIADLNSYVDQEQRYVHPIKEYQDA